MQEKKIIPRIIHFVWVGGKEKPKFVLDNIESWKKCCPEYEIKEWNEGNFDIESVPYVRQAYENKKYAFVSDYIRLYALYNEGGIYLDTDIVLYKNIDELLENDFFASFENMVAISIAAIGGVKGNKICKELLATYENRNFINGIKVDLTTNVILATVFFNEKYGVKLNGDNQTIIKNEKITIYNKEYFFPQDYVSKEIEITPLTLGNHIYSSTWLTKKQQREDRFVENVRKFFGKRLFFYIEKTFLKIRVSVYKRKLKKYLE